MPKVLDRKRQKQALEEEIDFSGLMMDSPNDDAVVNIMGNLIEAQRHQQQTALDLTRLVVEKNTILCEKDIFSIYKW